MTVSSLSKPSISSAPNVFPENTPSSSNVDESRLIFVEDQLQRTTAIYHRVRSFSMHSGSIRSLISCKNGSTISAFKNNVKVWSPKTGQLHLKLLGPGSSFATNLIYLQARGMARLFDPLDNTPRLRKLADESIAMIFNLKFSLLQPVFSRILIWNPDRGSRQFLYHLNKENNNIVDCKSRALEVIVLSAESSTSHKHRLATICSNDSYITIWNLDLDKESQWYIKSGKIRGHQGTITAMCLLKDGSILTASSDKTLKIWDVNTKKCLTTFQQKQSCQVIFVGEFKTTKFVSISDLGNIEIWDRKQETSIDSFGINSGKLIFCQLLSTDRILSINQHGVAEIWDPQTHACLQKFDDSQYRSATETPDGDLLLGNRKGDVSIFSPKDKDPIEDLRAGIGEESLPSNVKFLEGESRIEDHLAEEETWEVTPIKDPDLDSDLSDKPTPEKFDDPELCIDEASDSTPEQTNVSTLIDSESEDLGIREVEYYLAEEEAWEVTPIRDPDLDSSDISDRSTSEKVDDPELYIDVTSDSTPEPTDVSTLIDSDSKSSTEEKIADTTVEEDSLLANEQKASSSQSFYSEEEVSISSSDAVFIEISELDFDIHQQIKSAMTHREQTLEQEMRKVRSTLHELKSFEKRQEDQAKVDAFINQEAVSLKTELESTRALVSELEIWKEERESNLQVLLKKERECGDDLKKFEEHVKQLEETTRLREQAQIDEEFAEKRATREMLEELIKQQQEQKRLLDVQCKLYSQEIEGLQTQHKLLANQQCTQNEKLKPIYEKYCHKKEILKEQQKLTSSKEVKAFYKTLEEEFGKKLHASILLTSGLLQRSTVKKDLLANAAGYAVEGVFAFVAGMISIGTLGASTLIIGTAAAVAGVAAGKSTEELVAARIDKKYENRAQEVSAAICNPKHAWIVAESVARQITKRYLPELKKNGFRQNQVWATKAADVLYLFIASGKLKEKDCKTEDEMIRVLIEVLEEHLEAERDKRNIGSNRRCEIL